MGQEYFKIRSEAGSGIQHERVAIVPVLLESGILGRRLQTNVNRPKEKQRDKGKREKEERREQAEPEP